MMHRIMKETAIEAYREQADLFADLHTVAERMKGKRSFPASLWAGNLAGSAPPYIVKSFFLEDQGFFSVSLINISEEGAIGMDISLYLVRK